MAVCGGKKQQISVIKLSVVAQRDSLVTEIIELVSNQQAFR